MVIAGILNHQQYHWVDPTLSSHNWPTTIARPTFEDRRIGLSKLRSTVNATVKVMILQGRPRHRKKNQTAGLTLHEITAVFRDQRDPYFMVYYDTIST